MILRLMARYFLGRGYLVETSETAEEAERLLSGRRFDVVVSDLGLSGAGSLEGFDLVDRAKDAHPAIRSIVLTGICGSDLDREAAIRGVDTILTKPQSMATLEATVRGLLDLPVEPNEVQ